jgi:hypothetical protein
MAVGTKDGFDDSVNGDERMEDGAGDATGLTGETSVCAASGSHSTSTAGFWFASLLLATDVSGVMGLSAAVLAPGTIRRARNCRGRRAG